MLRDGKPTEDRRQVRHAAARRASWRPTRAGDKGPGLSSPEGRHAEHPLALGMTLAPLDEAMRAHLGLPADLRGALVLSVKDSSDASDKGLKSGDIIVRAGDRNVNSPPT